MSLPRNTALSITHRPTPLSAPNTTSGCNGAGAADIATAPIHPHADMASCTRRQLSEPKMSGYCALTQSVPFLSTMVPKIQYPSSAPSALHTAATMNPLRPLAAHVLTKSAVTPPERNTMKTFNVDRTRMTRGNHGLATCPVSPLSIALGFIDTSSLSRRWMRVRCAKSGSDVSSDSLFSLGHREARPPPNARGRPTLRRRIFAPRKSPEHTRARCREVSV